MLVFKDILYKPSEQNGITSWTIKKESAFIFGKKNSLNVLLSSNNKIERIPDSSRKYFFIFETIADNSFIMNPMVMEKIANSIGLKNKYETIRVNINPTLCNIYIYSDKENLLFLLKQLKKNSTILSKRLIYNHFKINSIFPWSFNICLSSKFKPTVFMFKRS